jgi:ribonuclease HI
MRSLFTLTLPHDTEAARVAPLFVLTFISGVYLLRKRWIAKGSRMDVVQFVFTHFSNVCKSINCKVSRKNKKGQEAIARLDSIPSNSILIFTDGSAIPNPGHAGAGAWVSIPGRPPFFLYEPLGHGTNNLGELWAIGMALQFLTDCIVQQDIFIITDSEWAIGKIVKCAPGTPEFDPLVRAIVALTNNLPGKTAFSWVQSHRGLTRNEIADRLAKLGSRKSAQLRMDSKIFNGVFSYSIKQGMMGEDLGDG